MTDTAGRQRETEAESKREGTELHPSDRGKRLEKEPLGVVIARQATHTDRHEGRKHHGLSMWLCRASAGCYPELAHLPREEANTQIQ